ncbi:globin [Pseudovibrio japonicus]|uniref:Globin n=1 Tax=Pseudovibrio japonicus TaxID=366534 RepID=A0ABQ3EL46_9HYPH|nr:group III truncated hemoglobin [Pseudovibrio japonicus]GHB40021.1 globin [Pseudovibrio japonicus]
METGQLQIIDGKAVKAKSAQASPEAIKRRLKQQSAVLEMGITPEVLEEIVEEFYARVKAHPVLRPLFDEPIDDRWPEHLEKMKSFWLSIALNAGTYSGKPVPAHQVLKTVEPWHFDIWLDLFQRTVQDITQSEAATEFLTGRAARIGKTLKTAMFRGEGA